MDCRRVLRRWVQARAGGVVNAASMPAAAGHRNSLLAKVHIGAKALGLEGEAYGEVLDRITGSSSAKSLDDRQLAAVLDEFRRLGWRAAAPKRPLSPKAQVRMIYGIWGDLGPFVETHTVEALRAFVRRQTASPAHPDGVAAPEFLDAKQAIKVVEGLKAWLIRVRAEAVGAKRRPS